jgi:ABC-type glycerol-3-phosphate transport system substrate-binding protein
LLDFCKAISAAGLPAFIHSANTNYYSFLYDAWFAQYNGTDGVNDYFDGIYENFMGERVVGYDVTHNQGILEAIKVKDSIFGGGYSHPKSNAIDWEVTQTYFMIGEAAMFANGDWHHQEMMKQFPDSDIRFLRVPVVSALGTKLGITDEQLAQFIDYADGKRGLPEVSTEKHTAQELAEIICDARSHVASYADFFMTYIPVYADNVDLAKTFLKFMVSDQGQHIFCEATKGLTQCYGYDLESDALYDNLSTFAKTRWDIAKDANLYILNRGNAYARVGLQPFTVKSKAPIEALLSRTDDRWTVEEIYEYDYETYKAKWSILEDGANSIDVN